MLSRLLTSLGDWFAPARNTSAMAAKGGKRRYRYDSALEPLESRIAPAVLVSPHVVTYTDTNGAHVTITSSVGIFSSANANALLNFTTGTVDGTSTPQSLHEINLGASTLSAKVLAGDNISITATGGSTTTPVYVGLITSPYSLGHVAVQGDLGQILAGASNQSLKYVGLGSLTVNSFGEQDVSAASTVISTIKGNVGSLTVQKDMIAAEFSVISSIAGTAVNGSINSVKIGGSLIGGSAAQEKSGAISTTLGVKTIVIGGDIQGGAGEDSGSLQIEGKIGSLTVNNIIGYTVANDATAQGAGSGSVVTGNDINSSGIGSLTVNGNIIGGDGDGSGQINQVSFTTGSFAKVKIAGMLKGGTGNNSGELDANAFGSISIGTGIIGSSGTNSGSITTPNGIGSLTILGGGIAGGTGTESGSVFAATSPTQTANIGSIVIHGDITGSATAAAATTGTGQINSMSNIGTVTLYGSLVGSIAQNTGSIISTGTIQHVTLHAEGASTGSIVGGDGSDSGQISATTLGSISIAGKIQGGGTISMDGKTKTGSDSGKIVATDSIGSVTVGTGIFGGIGDGSGVISTGTGFGANLGALTITSGGITGGSGSNSGQVQIGGTIGSVKLNGAAITGGTANTTDTANTTIATAANSGAILATDSIGSISLGSLVTGTGANSGVISTGGNLTTLTFTGSTATSTTVGGVVEIGGSAGTISVHGDVAGTAASSGLFEIGGAVKNFSISGALRGGANADSGAIFAGLDETSSISSLTISGGVIGGAGAGAGEVFAGGGIVKASVGDLIGAGGKYSGSIISDGALGAIKVTGLATGQNVHGLVGGSGDFSGQISAGTTIGSVSVAGNLQGGAGTGSGSIISNSKFTPTGDVQGNIGTITVTKSVTGGSGDNSGAIEAAGNLKTVTIGGNVMGGGAALNGSFGIDTGSIIAGMNLTGDTGGDITTLKITGGLIGTTATVEESINGSGFIQGGHIGSITVGSIQAGGEAATLSTAANDGAIRAANDIGSLTVNGNITGTYANAVEISAVGQLNPPAKGLDLAIGKINVSGNVTFADMLAGYDTSGDAANGAASIGPVVVGGNWSGSNLAAAVIPHVDHTGAPASYVSPNATLITNSASIVPTIASIIIKGSVVDATVPSGDTDFADTYGFAAKKIGSISVKGVTIPLTNAVNHPIPIPGSTDTDVLEIS